MERRPVRLEADHRLQIDNDGSPHVSHRSVGQGGGETKTPGRSDGPDDILRPSESEEDWFATGWATEAAEATAAKKLAVTFSVRFEPDDAALLRRAARLSRQTRSEFVRNSTIEAARRTVLESQPTFSLRPLPARVEGRHTHMSSQQAKRVTLDLRPAARSTKAKRPFLDLVPV